MENVLCLWCECILVRARTVRLSLQEDTCGLKACMSGCLSALVWSHVCMCIYPVRVHAWPQGCATCNPLVT